MVPYIKDENGYTRLSRSGKQFYNDNVSQNAMKVVHGINGPKDSALCVVQPATCTSQSTPEEIVAERKKIQEQGWNLCKFQTATPRDAAMVLIATMDNSVELNRRGFSLKLPDGKTVEQDPVGVITELYKDNKYLGNMVVMLNPQKEYELGFSEKQQPKKQSYLDRLRAAEKLLEPIRYPDNPSKEDEYEFEP